MMMFRHRQSDEHCRKHCEDVCLNEGNKEFKAIKEDCKEHCQRSHDAIDRSSNLGCDEDHSYQRQECSMTCHDVGKETNHECDWLGEESKELDDCHDWLQPCWHSICPEY